MDDQYSLAETLEWGTTRRERPSRVPVPAAAPLPLPEKIGRYEVQKLLGEGAFGQVFLAYDWSLRRKVAIKTPLPELVSTPGEAESYLEEARTLASLDHPHVVPVYDVGGCDEFPCYIVYKYIEGESLGDALKRESPPFHRSVRLVSAIADALHCAHCHGLVHRDIKPGNVLIDTDGRPYLADFGLALQEETAGRSTIWGGTPDYMSPEQASGEIAHLDARSDIFSLGTVFYRMLTGKLPFHGDSVEEIIANIKAGEPRPPRQRDSHIPRALEAICLRAMAHDKSQRYTTALDMREDLDAATTYNPKPIDVSTAVLPPSMKEMVESLAQNNHDVWAKQRIADGWQVGDMRDDSHKTHPLLVPYEQMSEEEKQYDREAVETTLKSLMALGWATIDEEA